MAVELERWKMRGTLKGLRRRVAVVGGCCCCCLGALCLGRLRVGCAGQRSE